MCWHQVNQNAIHMRIQESGLGLTSVMLASEYAQLAASARTCTQRAEVVRDMRAICQPAEIKWLASLEPCACNNSRSSHQPAKERKRKRVLVVVVIDLMYDTLQKSFDATVVHAVPLSGDCLSHPFRDCFLVVHKLGHQCNHI